MELGIIAFEMTLYNALTLGAIQVLLLDGVAGKDIKNTRIT